MSDIKQEKDTSDVVRESMREYGLYVLEDRALPDIRDGLKPVQRRILWSLQSMRRGSTAIPVKCATAVGDTINTAARLQEFTKLFHEFPVIMSRDAWKGLVEHPYHSAIKNLGIQKIRGKKQQL